MSRNRIIPADQAIGLVGWPLTDLDDPATVQPDDEAEDPPVSPEVLARREAVPVPVPIADVVVQPAAPPAIPPEELFRAELEAARAEARAAGFEAGQQAGYATGEAEAASLRMLVGHLRELVEDLEQGIANDVLSLALELSKQIVRTSLRVRPDLVMAVIREVSKGFQGLGESPRLILHPADAALMRQTIEADPAGEWPWTIVEDAVIERGGCKFQTGASEVDATLETRWRRVVASLGRDDAWLDLNL